MRDLKERAVRGGFAKICSQAVNFVLRLGSLMVLARLLDPKDFGLVAMVTAVSGVFAFLKDAGLSMASVQRPTITSEQSSTLFWINMLVGSILAFLLIAMAPVLVAFYHEKRLYWVAVVLAIDFLFAAAAVQHSALLQRQMRFVAVAVIEIIALAVGIAVGIGMAMGGFGYWALVGMAVVQPAVLAMCVWPATGWIPGMPRRDAEIRSMIRFGGTVTLNGLIVYVAYNMEKILLGRFWGAEALGVYDRGYQLINLPTSNLNSAVGAVAFAALSRVQDDSNRLKSYFLKSYSLLVAVTLPITIACAVFADDLIFVILGPKWKDTVMIFRLLSPTIVIFALINPMAWLLLSTGRVGRSLRIALVIAPLVIAAYLIGLPYGPSGVACAYSVVMTLWAIPHIAWCIHDTVVSSRDLLRAAGRPFVSGIVAAALAVGVQFYFGQLLSPFPRLLLGCGVMLVSYLWMLLYVMGQKVFYVDFLRVLIKRSQAAERESVGVL